MVQLLCHCTVMEASNVTTRISLDVVWNFYGEDSKHPTHMQYYLILIIIWLDRSLVYIRKLKTMIDNIIATIELKHHTNN